MSAGAPVPPKREPPHTLIEPSSLRAGNGYTKIYSTGTAFAALRADGSIKAWGDSKSGGKGAPIDKGYTKIYSNENAFTAVKSDGSIRTWGNPDYGGAYASQTQSYLNYIRFLVGFM